MNKQFKITVTYEESFSFYVDAPNIVLAEEKAKPKKAARLMTTEELKAAKLPPGTSAQIDAEGKINVISKPSADALKSAFGAKQIKAILGDVANKYVALDNVLPPLVVAFFTPSYEYSILTLTSAE